MCGKKVNLPKLCREILLGVLLEFCSHLSIILDLDAVFLIL